MRYGLLVLLTSLLVSGCAAKTTAAPDTTCTEATQHVKAYQAPGQRTTLAEAVAKSLAAERRPVQIQGWAPAQKAGSDCMVILRTTIGNEAQSFYWVWSPATGKVAANNDATKRLSGW